MRRKKFSFIAIIIFSLLVTAYALSLRFQKNARYTKVFHQFGKDCVERGCPLSKRISLAEKALYYDPEFSQGYATLGKLRMENGEVKEALGLYQKSLGLDHHNEDALLQLGIYYFNENDLAQSQRYLHHFESFYNRNYALRYYLGRIHERLGDRFRALDYYQEALKMDTTNDLRLLARIGALEVRSGNVKEAFECAQQIRSKGDEDLAMALENFAKNQANKEFMPNEGVKSR